MLVMCHGGNTLRIINSMSHLSHPNAPSVSSMFDEVWKTLRSWHGPKSRNSVGFHDGADEFAGVPTCSVAQVARVLGVVACDLNNFSLADRSGSLLARVGEPLSHISMHTLRSSFTPWSTAPVKAMTSPRKPFGATPSLVAAFQPSKSEIKARHIE